MIDSLYLGTKVERSAPALKRVNIYTYEFRVRVKYRQQPLEAFSASTNKTGQPLWA